jgi:hypothetical protein
MTPNEQSPNEIERDIRHTRAEIDRTLGALQDKLSPGQLLDQALGYMKTVPGEFATNLGRSLRDNPLPVTLLGIGLGWLMMTPRPDGYGPRSRQRSTRTSFSGVAAESLEEAETLEARVNEEVQAQAERVGDYAQQAWDQGKRLAHRAEGYGQSAWDQGKRATDAVTRFVDDYPFAVAAFGLAIGVAAAACLPRSRREDELLGETSDRVKQAVRDTASEQAEMTIRSASSGTEANREAERKLGRMGELSTSTEN